MAYNHPLYPAAPERMWDVARQTHVDVPSMFIPVAETMMLTVGKVETGYAVSVASTRSNTPKVYAGSTLEQCVQAIMAEFVAAKLES